MTKFISNLSQSNFSESNLWLSNRLLFNINVLNQNGELENKIQENQDKEVAKLSTKIDSWEKAGKNATEIKQELQKEKKRIYIDAVNQAFKELKSKLTYNDAIKDANDKAILDGFENKYEQNLTSQIDKYVDSYQLQKQINSGVITKALRQVPPATAKSDLETPNPEIQRLKELQADREKVKAESKGKRADLLSENVDSRGAMRKIDEYTSPDSKYDHGIKDYDDGVFGNATDYNNPTRSRLNGLLYANYVFYGAGKGGMSAVESTIESAYKIVGGTLYNDRFKMSHLSEKMGMGSYIKEAESYSKDDRVVGMIAGMKKLLSENNPGQQAAESYEKYLDEQFQKVSQEKNASKQLQMLFQIKPITEALDVDKGWKAELHRIDKMTDPKREGNDVIDDYPGWGKDNKENKTRKQLNGYLYANYLFGNHDKKAVDSEYKAAYKMYDDFGYVGDIFDQTYLEEDQVDGKADQKGFGLKDGLAQADTYTEHEQVKGVIAGLIKLSEHSSPEYKAYLNTKFELVQQQEGEDGQMLILSSIKAPSEFLKEIDEKMRLNFIDLLIKASEQHNQMAFKNAEIDKFKTDKNYKPDFPKLDKAALEEAQKFIKTRTDQAMNEKDASGAKDNPDGLKFKIKLLKENNGSLKNALYSDADIKVLDDRITELDKQFDGARSIAKLSSFDAAIKGEHLKNLSEAEKQYFVFAEELDKKVAAIAEQANKPKEPTAVTGGAPTGPGAVPIIENQKPKETIESAWENGKEVNPSMGEYTGNLVVNTAKANARDDSGNSANTFAKDTVLFRSVDDALLKGKLVTVNGSPILYVRVTDGANHYWVTEKFLTQKTDIVPLTPVEPPESKKPPVVPIEQPPKVEQKNNNSFEGIKYQAENDPNGAVFSMIFNGQPLPCRLQRMPDGYHLMYNTPDAQGNIVFPDINQVQPYLDKGNFYQYLNTQMLQDQRVWDRYKDTKWVDNAVEIKRSGPYSVNVELDWKRNNVFEKGNVKCAFDVSPDGKINYRLSKDYIGPRGENIRTGSVSDFTQLIEVLSHCKVWSENYEDNQDSAEFTAIQYREQQLTALMDARNYEIAGTRIGEKNYFQNFYNQGYAYMELNWDNQSDMFARNNSPTNPRLEVKLNPDNSISYRLTNHTGAGGTRMGCFGTVQSYDMLIASVEAVKKNPSSLMQVPISNIPVLREYPLAN